MLPFKAGEISVRSGTSPEKPTKKVCTASAATAKAAAAKKKKTVSSDEESDQTIMPSDSEEEAMPAKKALRKHMATLSLRFCLRERVHLT